jgi:tRNA A37 methylthiotransferase MiaB
MPGQVPIHVARERNRVLRELAARKNLEFRQGFMTKTLQVITLQSRDAEFTDALSDNYLKTQVRGTHPGNTVLAARITGVTHDSLLAMAADS